LEPPGTTILLDTDVLIDCLRGLAPARAWLTGHATEVFDVPGIVAMELLMGCRNQTEMQQTQAFLSSFNIVWPDSNDFVHAYTLMEQHRLTTALSIPDYLIAAMALARATRLYSFNLKHFQVVPSLDVQEPYARP
jgi:predicted nucleic acid-binding protein